MGWLLGWLLGRLARVAAKAVSFEKKGVAKARRPVAELRKFLRDS